jgi:hypothetical protein
MGDWFDSTSVLDEEDFWIDRFKEERQAARAATAKTRHVWYACSAFGFMLAATVAVLMLVRVH